MWSRLALNSQSSYLDFLSVGIIVMCTHAGSLLSFCMYMDIMRGCVRVCTHPNLPHLTCTVWAWTLEPGLSATSLPDADNLI
jgi:hypothetical protein